MRHDVSPVRHVTAYQKLHLLLWDFQDKQPEDIRRHVFAVLGGQSIKTIEVHLLRAAQGTK